MNGAPLRILCLCFRTPPETRPQAILIGKLIPEWIRQGAQPIIVTYQKDTAWDIPAPTLCVPPPPNRHILGRIPLIRELLDHLYYKRLMRLIDPIMQQNTIDVVFSFSNPYASNVLGACLKKKYHIPFVAHFSDPWVDNPLAHYSWPLKMAAFLQERVVMKHADHAVFVNEQMRALVMKKYPASWSQKTSVIPHCFDPMLHPPRPAKKDGPFTISYIGAFYPDRGPEPLIKLIELLRKKNPAMSFKLQLIGTRQTYYTGFDQTTLFSDPALSACIETVPVTSYQDSLHSMAKADCLIAMDVQLPTSPFLPSKLIDYAGSGTPIVGLAPKGSPTELFLAELGYACFPYDALPEMVDYIITSKPRLQTKDLNTSFLARFSVQAITRQWLATLQVVKERTRRSNHETRTKTPAPSGG